MKKIWSILLVVALMFNICFGTSVQVDAAGNKGIKLNKTKTVMTVGNKMKLKVIPKESVSKVKWHSSNKKVATVSQKGIVKAKKAGTVKITAKHSRKGKAVCKIRVYKATKKIKLQSKRKYSLNPGDTIRLKAKVTKPKSKAEPIKWSSKNRKIATVNAKGKVKAKSVGTTYIKGKSGNKSVKVRITVKERKGPAPQIKVDKYSTTETNYVSEEYITVAGTSQAYNGKIVSVSYVLTSAKEDEAAVTGKADGKDTWRIKNLPLQIGTNFLTLIVTDSGGNTGEVQLVFNRLSKEVELSENVAAFEEKENLQIAEDIIDYWTYDMGTQDTSDDQVRILFPENSALVQAVKKGEIKEQDVVMIQPCEALYLGFNGIFVSYAEPEDAEKYPADEYEVISFEAAGLTDVFQGDISLSYEVANVENPVAFAYFPTDVEVAALNDEGEQERILYSTEEMLSEVEEDSKKQKIEGEGFQKSAVSYMMEDAFQVREGISGEKGLNVELKFKDAVFFDKDGKGETTDDQLKLGGTFTYKDFKVDVGIEGHSFGILPQQIMAKYLYNTDVDIHADWTGSMDLKNFVQAANKKLNHEFENNKQFLGWTLSGVDTENSIILGMFGIYLSPVGLGTTVGIKPTQTTSTFLGLNPVAVVIPVLDVTGNLSAKVGFTYNYSSYQEKGINVQKKDFCGSYGPLEDNKGQESIDLPFGYSLEKYDVCARSKDEKDVDPKWSIALVGEGDASAEVALGADLGLMLNGIMPMVAEGRFYGKAQVKAAGEAKIGNGLGLPEGTGTVEEKNKVSFDVDGDMTADVCVGVRGDMYFKLCLKYDNVEIPLESPKLEGNLVLFDWGVSSIRIKGNVSEKDDDMDDLNNKVLDDVTVLLQRTDLLDAQPVSVQTDLDGNFEFKNVKNGKYTLRFEKDGYVTCEKEISIDGESKELSIHMSPKPMLSNPRIVEDGSMESGQKVTWDCVWFGSYPQAEVIPSGEYTALDASVLQNGDVIVSDSIYLALQNATGWDDKNEITLNGTKYRRIKKEDATISLYYQWMDNATYHYFEYEPIKWRVLHIDGNQALLLSDIVLDDQKYNDRESITWETSTIRNWLNGYGVDSNQKFINHSQNNFINSAFTTAERPIIIDSVVENEDNISLGTEGGNNTIDKIFLLSELELCTTDKAALYGFVKDGYIYDESRRSKSSTYAKAMGTRSGPDMDYVNNCAWWLRSPGRYSFWALVISSEGWIDSYGNEVHCCVNGVRPALNLNLLSSDLYSYAGTVCSDGTVNETGDVVMP